MGCANEDMGELDISACVGRNVKLTTDLQTFAVDPDRLPLYIEHYKNNRAK